MTLADAVHRRAADNIVEAGNLEPRDVRLEDLQREWAQRLCYRLLIGHRQPHLPADPGIQLRVAPLNLQRDGLQLAVDVADGGTARQVGHTAQALQPQPSAKQAALFNPGPDVLTAKSFSLKTKIGY